VGFLALSLEPDRRLVGEAVRTLGIGLDVAITRDEVLAPLGVRAVPSTVFVDARGTVVAAASGVRSEAFFEKRVRELLEGERLTGRTGKGMGNMALKLGDIAPEFDLPSTTGRNISLASLRGKKVVLYFYPKDQTPGCTREACDFRDRHAALEGSGAVVLGVSKDSLKSHANFREKQSLPFPLLSDPDNAVAKAYGAYGEKTSYGKTTLGTIRSTFLIDEDGRIERIWSPVKVDGHAEEVLLAVKGGKGPDATKMPPAGMATGILAAQHADRK
jgi:peroxiredoxin Q/BCP